MSQSQEQIKTTIDTSEPTVGPSTVPIWLILLLGLLTYWGMNFVDSHGGGFSKEVFEPFTSQEEVASSQPYDPEGAQLAVGKAMFDKTCALCHQANGMGKEGQFPPLVGSEWLLAPGPSRVGRIVLHGLTGPIRLEAAGGTVSINATMAPLGVGTDYTDEQLAAAITYVRHQWGNNGQKVTADEIKAIRAASASHPGPFTQDELDKIPVTQEASAK